MKNLFRPFAIACLLAAAGVTTHAADYDSSIAQARDNVQKQ